MFGSDLPGACVAAAKARQARWELGLVRQQRPHRPRLLVSESPSRLKSGLGRFVSADVWNASPGHNLDGVPTKVQLKEYWCL